ncbi:G3E family GTPase [Bartonella fuyuanensis]|uniref:G3E family GTPase n=1 Tax=Bartonella fuyuanensis TaxID=1460968 RepID=A0A840DZ43_9HYPH|nr:G3E family GTPase [Bartonella fuyuanensis]
MLSNTLLNTFKTMNPTAQIIDAHSEDFCSNLLINNTFWNEKGKNTQIKQKPTSIPHNHAPYKTIRTFPLDHEDPIDYTIIETFLDLLQNRYGAKLLCVNAIKRSTY